MIELKFKGSGGRLLPAGSIACRPRGLVWRISNRRVRASLMRAVQARLRAEQYYVVFAVRGRGGGLDGMVTQHVRPGDPAVLDCMIADEALWRRKHGGELVVGKLVRMSRIRRA